MIAGVSAGLGRYFDITPTVFRLAFVVLALLGGAGILVYIAAALVMPREGEQQSFAERALSQRREHPWRLVALGLIAIAILSVLSQADTWPSAGTAWFIAVVGLIVLAVTSVRRWRRLVIVLGDDRGGARRAGRLHGRDRVLRLRRLVERRRRRPQLHARHRHWTSATATRWASAPWTSTSPTCSANRRVNVVARVGIGDLRVIVPITSRWPSTPAPGRARSTVGQQQDGSHARVVAGDGRYTLDLHVGAGQIDVERAP